ncbi:NAD(P)-binding domain-containing protein [Aliikangiella sp. G2MR2-5]|uniref:NAD(P)-binding domain-containing protein n=1 Tax=Aliikangiella sp. G2MR2-5 TaxID=2788943 RepID=UPI0018AB80B9|nr:NAD(P)-binding domain-containing protein [Aliikangiella sp. G2MR2-5]
MERKNTFDYIILGAGPAGLQLGFHFEQTGEDYKILEAGEQAGTSFEKFPRHRTLISINKVHTGYDDKEVNLRWDWNSLLNDHDDFLFKDFDQDYFPHADSLVEYMNEYAKRYNLNIDYGQRISSITREGEKGQFILTNEQGEQYFCNKLVVATGFGKANQPNIPGMELADCYTEVSVDPKDFINQEVLIIGKGNSAFETADSLTPTASVIHVISPEVLQFAWETHYVGHLRAVNNNFLDTYQLKSQNALLDAFIEKIEIVDGKYHVSVDYLHANGEKEVLVYDRIINCTGFKFDNSIFDPSIKPEMCNMNKFPMQNNDWESTNVSDMYFAGTITHVRDFRKTTSGFIHGFRYNVKALSKILKHKYKGAAIESRNIDSDVESIIENAMQRVNTSSALWQQFGFLCDVIDLDAGQEQAKYYDELPMDYIREAYFKDSRHYLTVSLEFGKVVGNPFAIDRNPVPEKAKESVFLHPVFRQIVDGEVVGEFHLLENLYGEWHDHEHHIQPLREYLTEALAVSKPSQVEAIA